MRVLVTGAAGFIGRHVARHFLDHGFDVTAFDLDPFDEPGITSIVGDLGRLDQIGSAAQGKDVICHIGAIGDVYLAADNPPLAAAVNVTGSANVAEAALSVGARIVYASTWEVYGRPRYEPVDEDHPCEPDHPYNITKLAGEQMLLAADRLRGVPVLVLRLGTAYGEGLRTSAVLSAFIERARRGDPIVIQGDGSQSRQFTHVSDLARAFALACQSDLHGLAFNTTSAEQVSIKQLAELVVARFPTPISYTDRRPGDVPSALVSSDRIRRMLGWVAEIPFEEGLSRLITQGPSG